MGTSCGMGTSCEGGTSCGRGTSCGGGTSCGRGKSCGMRTSCGTSLLLMKKSPKCYIFIFGCYVSLAFQKFNLGNHSTTGPHSATGLCPLLQHSQEKNECD